jgi:hypothetical protein
VEIMRLKTQAAMTATIAMTTLGLLLMAGSAGAQFQYTAPGGPEEQPASRKEALELEVTRARYRLGPMRVAPWATLRDVAYVRPIISAGEPLPADFTATVGAGFRAYLRNGPKVTWTLGVLPEYVWWHKQTGRRLLSGRYQAGFHGFFNRLTLEATAGREQALQIVTPEVPILASSRTDKAEVLTELELTPALFAFVSGSALEQTNLEDDTRDPRLEILRLLDRRERVARGGLRWQPRQELSLGLGVEGSRADFSRSAVARSNSGTAPLALFSYRGHRLGFEGEVAFRSLEARRGSAFVPYHKPTGRAALMLGSGRTLAGTLYASRNLIYSLASNYAYLQDNRLGFSLQGSLGYRFHISGFVETGPDEYTAFVAGSPNRRDDVTSYGTTIDYNITQDLIVGLKGLRSSFVSNLPGTDRTYTSVGLTVNFGGR